MSSSINQCRFQEFALLLQGEPSKTMHTVLLKVVFKDDITEDDPLQGLKGWKKILKTILPSSFHPQVIQS